MTWTIYCFDRNDNEVGIIERPTRLYLGAVVENVSTVIQNDTWSVIAIKSTVETLKIQKVRLELIP